MKNIIHEQITHLNNDDFEGLVDKVIEKLQNLRETYSGQYFDLEIEYRSYYDSGDYYLYGKRQETDIEENKRLQKENREKENKVKRKKEKELKELKELERLQKKYGKIVP